MMQFEKTNTRQNKDIKRGTSSFLKVENGEALLSPRILLLKYTGYEWVFVSHVETGKNRKNIMRQGFSITIQGFSDKLVVSAGLNLNL